MSFRFVYTPPLPALRRRLGHAGVSMGLSTPLACRHFIQNWVDGKIGATAEPVEAGVDQIRIPVTEAVHEKLRVAAAVRGVPVSDFVLCVLEAGCPHEIELLAKASGGS
jgi:hypothetical protein